MARQLIVRDYATTFLEEYLETYVPLDHCRAMRESYWHAALPFPDHEEKAIELIDGYVLLVERALQSIVSTRSVAYWYHLSRRLHMIPGGLDMAPATLANIAATLDAAVQKFGQRSNCGHIGGTATAPLDRILDGRFQGRPDELETLTNGHSEMVLLDTGFNDLATLARAKTMAYEMWLAMARRRTVAKGGHLSHAPAPDYYVVERSDELASCIRRYDARLEADHVSEAAVLFSTDDQCAPPDGYCLFPMTNHDYVVSSENYLPYSVLGLHSDIRFTPPYVWVPFPIREFLATHAPFAASFADRYGLSLVGAVAALVALSHLHTKYWPSQAMRHHVKGYWGPWETPRLMRELRNLNRTVGQTLDLHIDGQTIQSGIAFWQLATQSIDVPIGGPHSIIVPVDRNRVLLDLTWGVSRLLMITRGLDFEGDGNFKSSLMEVGLRSYSDISGGKRHKALDGTSKQFDAIIPLGADLLAFEAKAVVLRPGFVWGNPDSIKQRTDRAIDRPLSQIDQKTRWLARRPVGTNYDYSQYSRIIPVAASPFVEYLPSRETKYWLTDEIPRVLSISEIANLLDQRDWMVDCRHYISFIPPHPHEVAEPD